MMKKLTIAGAAFAMGATALIPATPAMAQGYSQYDRYGQPYRGYRNDRVYRGRDGYYRNDFRNNYRVRQRCQDGDGGTIVGAIAGGLAGNAIAGRGDRTLGTILGGALGAVAGRAIDRSDRPNYCR